MAEGSASKPVSLPGKPKAAAVRQGNKVWGMPDYTDADPSKWVVIFPHYLDSTRKRSGGRKIATSKAVESPGANEIFEVVRELGLRTQLELDKAYCRDCWLPGRVRIELFDEAGSPIQPDLARSRQALFLTVASLLPKFRDRAKAEAQTGSKNSGGGSSNGGGGSGRGAAAAAPKKKKKGKR